MSLYSIPFTFIFLSYLCNLVNADGNIGGYIGGGIGGLIIIILDIIAIFDVLGTPRTIIGKLLWILLIIIFPIGGLIIWLLFGRKTTPVI
ncbi:unnamed protein product [Rotaria sordida]|uniref:Cardiolipin synthase N-terminal domain-containing protein n=1 Tax=Rotaria sordida TaxID=392033 RepID=A0A818TQC2_9BILA|nr:unnamed protein product [Rotaria sordida]CAF1056646.1 unnamed protein product [Rotaria sordida]CAF3687068.1 unnamed protein product [Rotaria sordida]CAF4005310.1 unnamed protein product [Rotaria sordida]